MALALALLAALPRERDVAHDWVERLELNNFYDDQGRLVFTQMVGWHETEHVRFWRMVKDSDLVVERDHAHQGYTLTFRDGGLLRRVHARSYDESWTQYDVEVADREYLPKERRLELRTWKSSHCR